MLSILNGNLTAGFIDHIQEELSFKTTRNSGASHYLARNIPSAVPVPAAIWLFVSGLIGLIGLRKRRKA